MASTQTSRQGSLLILPALSWPFQRSSLRTAYRPAFQAVLRKVADSVTDGEAIARLDVALVLSASYLISPNDSRAAMFTQVQALFEETYSLVCTVAARENIELDFPGGVDVRIFLLEPRTEGALGDVLGKQSLSGPLVDVQTFAISGRQYSPWYAAEGEDGAVALDAVAKAYWSRGQMTPSVERLPYGTAIASAGGATEAANSAIAADISNKRSTTTTDSIHISVAVGGTFDHLHIGHKLLLSLTAFLPEPTIKKARHITVGITGDELLKNKKFASQVGSWELRQAETAAFIESILVFAPEKASGKQYSKRSYPGNVRAVVIRYGRDLGINYCQINDPFGPTITDESISALVISKETRAGGKAVNDRREEKGWKELEVFEVDVLDASEREDLEPSRTESFEAKISSTEIRRRLAERQRET